MAHFLLNFHPDFEDHFEQWLYAWDHLHSDVYDQENGNVRVIDSLVPDGLETQVGTQTELRNVDREYLIHKAQGEVPTAFRERQKITSYTPHFPFAVSSLAGMFFDAQDDILPQWQPEDADEGLAAGDDAVSERLEDNFNGEGDSFESWLWDTTLQLIAMGEVWPRVEGVVRQETDEGERDGPILEEASVQTEPPLRVENWVEERSMLREVQLCTEVDTRTSIRDDISNAREIRYVLFGPQGWEQVRAVRDTSNNEQNVRSEQMQSQEYEFWRTADQQRRILPIYKAELPLRGNPAYSSARDANSIYNLESALDFELWYSSFAKLMADVKTDEGINEDLWDELKESMREGSTVLPGAGHTYKSPPASAGQLKMERLSQKVETFYKTFFQRFGDAAKKKTATQIQQEARAGVQAFLVLLAHALENLVNEALWRLEQVYFPNQPQLWGQAQWTATKDFDPVDIETQVGRMVDRVFPAGKMPLTESTARQVITKWHRVNDLEEPDEAEMTEAVDRIVSREAQAQSVEQDFGL